MDDSRQGGAPEEGKSLVPFLRVTEDDDALRVVAEIPEGEPFDLSVVLDRDVLRITGARVSSSSAASSGRDAWRATRTVNRFTRAVRLPRAVNVIRARTRHGRGTLTMRLPLLEAPSAGIVPGAAPLQDVDSS